MGNSIGDGNDAINSLPIPKWAKSFIVVIVVGIFIGVWWAGNQVQINEISKLRDSIGELRTDLGKNYISKRDMDDLKRDLNWRLKLMSRRLNIEYTDMK